MKNITKHIHLNRTQRGAATLITSLVLLVAMTIISIFAARSSVMEQRIFANEFRAKQAFEAAEAGLEYGISYVLAPGGADKDTAGTAGYGTIDVLCNGTCMATPPTLASGADYRVTLTYDNTNCTTTNTCIRVTSIGRSDDDSAIQTVSQIVAVAPRIADGPSNPMTTKGSVNVGGSATITNPEANSTVWSGSSAIAFNGSGGTYIPDPSNPSNTVLSSSGTTMGADVVSGDTNLSTMTGDNFFKNFMGDTKNNFKAGADVAVIDPSNIGNTYSALDSDANGDGMLDNSGINMATYRTLWVNGNTSISGGPTVGCAIALSGSATCSDANSHPVIMVVDGDLAANGNVYITGIVYVTGNLTLGAGTFKVKGAVIVEGQVSGTGNMDVSYSSTVISKTKGTTGARALLAGSWKDF